MSDKTYKFCRFIIMNGGFYEEKSKNYYLYLSINYNIFVNCVVDEK